MCSGRSHDETGPDELMMSQGDDKTSLCNAKMKVSANMHRVNLYDVQCKLGPSIASISVCDDRPHDDSGPDDLMMSRVKSDEGGGRVRVCGEGDGGTDVYSSVQKLGDEKVLSVQKCLMKTGQLTRFVDQNQTQSRTRGGGSNRDIRQTLQSKILWWERNIQSENLADYSTDDARHHKTCGQTE